jgi:hypothetical protein
MRPGDERRPRASGGWGGTLAYLAVGIAAVLAVRALSGWRWLETQQEQAIDWMVRMNAGTEPDAFRGLPIVFLDVDEASHRRWGEPFHVPRRELAELIGYALRGPAALVLVDVDLSRAAGRQDEPLRALLAAHGPSDPPLVLARVFREPLPPGASPWREERPSFLDATVAAAPSLHWASTLFLRDADLLIRRFRSFEPTCSDGRANVVPAIQLLAAALLTEGATGAETLARALEARRPACDGTGGAPSPPRDERLRLGPLELSLRDDRLGSRILFAFGDGVSVPSVPFEGRRVPLLTRLPAHRVTDADPPPDAALVKSRIVVIGASYRESGDVHPTPLGEMPGPLVLANATHSLLQNGELRPPSAAALLLAQLAAVAVAALAFGRLARFGPTLLALLGVVALLLPLSFLLFRAGVWLDFALPLLLVQLFAFANRYRGRVDQMSEKLRVRVSGARSEP